MRKNLIEKFVRNLKLAKQLSGVTPFYTPVEQHKINKLINCLIAGNKCPDAAGRLELQSATNKIKNYTSQKVSVLYIHK